MKVNLKIAPCIPEIRTYPRQAALAGNHCQAPVGSGRFSNIDRSGGLIRHAPINIDA